MALPVVRRQSRKPGRQHPRESTPSISDASHGECPPASSAPESAPLSNTPRAAQPSPDMNIDDIAVPTYKGNYARYKAELRVFLECFSCQGLLDGSLQAPPQDASAEDHSAFADKDHVLWQALHRGLAGRELTETLDALGDAPSSAVDIWRVFVARKTHTTYGEHLARLERFHSSRFERGMNVYKWIAEQMELGEMLAYGGLKISDAEMADVLLIGSRDAYPGLASSLVSFNNVGEPMPRPSLIQVMDALDRAWRADQSAGKMPVPSPRHSETATPRRRARERRDQHERREERARREQERTRLTPRQERTRL